jgi:hypothetical protein
VRFGDRRVQALFSVLVLFGLQARAFMRALLAQLLGLDPAHCGAVDPIVGAEPVRRRMAFWEGC